MFLIAWMTLGELAGVSIVFVFFQYLWDIIENALTPLVFSSFGMIERGVGGGRNKEISCSVLILFLISLDESEVNLEFFVGALSLFFIQLILTWQIRKCL